MLAELLELAPGGVEETRRSGDVVEYAVYGAPGELPDLPELRAAAGDALVEVADLRGARRLGGALEGVPPAGRRRWRSPPARAPALGAGAGGGVGAIELVIDPGQAFGTGAHPTTRLCLELLLELEPGGALADSGCGSGVLAIAAAQLGWAPVRAVDHEPASLEATADNAARQRRRGRGRRADLRRAARRRGRRPSPPTCCARCCSTSPALERAPERLIASGLLREEADEVAAAFARHGLRERERRAGGEWAALLLAR